MVWVLGCRAKGFRALGLEFEVLGFRGCCLVSPEAG